MERRYFQSALELRAKKEGGDSNTMCGHAAVFNARSHNLGGFYEKLSPGCFDAALKRSDFECYSLFNHDPNLVLGVTTNGSHRVSQDKTGLYQECDLDPACPDGGKMIGHLRAGRITRMSFAMRVAPDGDDWGMDENGDVVRTVKSVDLLADTSPVTYAAYQAANVGMRALCSDGSVDVQALAVRAKHGLKLGKTDFDTLRTFAIQIEELLKLEKKEPGSAPVAVRTLEQIKADFEFLKQ